jgi:hypothetical protein
VALGHHALSLVRTCGQQAHLYLLVVPAFYSKCNAPWQSQHPPSPHMRGPACAARGHSCPGRPPARGSPGATGRVRRLCTWEPEMACPCHRVSLNLRGVRACRQCRRRPRRRLSRWPRSPQPRRPPRSRSPQPRLRRQQSWRRRQVRGSMFCLLTRCLYRLDQPSAGKQA